MRYPEAQWQPGPPAKQGYEGYVNLNSRIGVVLHSMDGNWATGGINVLTNGGTSWHFSVLRDGTILQHYELEAQCYHSGVATINRKTIGIEHEGYHSPEYGHGVEPLTEAQIVASVKLCNWIAGLAVPFALKRGETLWIHKDLGTSLCPGTRFDSILDRWLGVPTDLYPVPLAYFDWRGKSVTGEWINVWELRIHTIRHAPNVQLIPEGRHGDHEVYRLEVQDGVVTPEWPE